MGTQKLLGLKLEWILSPTKFIMSNNKHRKRRKTKRSRFDATIRNKRNRTASPTRTLSWRRILISVYHSLGFLI